MPMAAADIEAAILAALPGATVEITDLAGDGDHYAAVVTAPQPLQPSVLTIRLITYPPVVVHH
mgnify:CR=1 FL=1